MRVDINVVLGGGGGGASGFKFVNPKLSQLLAARALYRMDYSTRTLSDKRVELKALAVGRGLVQCPCRIIRPVAK